MAGNIQGLNINKLSGDINNYVSETSKMFLCASNVCKDIKQLPSYWTGKRMNDILKTYNSISNKLKTNLHFFDEKVQKALEEIYTQYKKMENEGVASDVSVKGTIKGIEEIPSTIALTPDEPVKFENQKVTNIVKDMNSNLDKMESHLNQMLGILDSIAPYSDSLNNLVKYYKEAGNTVKTTLLNLKQQIYSKVGTNEYVVKYTEEYNESDASRIKGGNKK